ncbi:MULTISPECIES: hypothetical protein [Herbaspirillum]|uniref:Uncharacterized protein n=2 Tax=Herbaspirillum huttiense TaxID=863372 RepID=A0AAJ2HAQ0_9BURK|nr:MULTISPECIES: hypothetical protein [Herbaspirillum]MDR9837011.1 hypothetical protein [Herbaspirillum huttiense]
MATTQSTKKSQKTQPSLAIWLGIAFAIVMFAVTAKNLLASIHLVKFEILVIVGPLLGFVVVMTMLDLKKAEEKDEESDTKDSEVNPQQDQCPTADAQPVVGAAPEQPAIAEPRRSVKSCYLTSVEKSVDGKKRLETRSLDSRPSELKAKEVRQSTKQAKSSQPKTRPAVSRVAIPQIETTASAVAPTGLSGFDLTPPDGETNSSGPLQQLL